MLSCGWAVCWQKYSRLIGVQVRCKGSVSGTRLARQGDRLFVFHSQITGNGDVLEPHDGIISIGSGSPYALAAARALIDVPGMDAASIGAPGSRCLTLIEVCSARIQQ